MMNQQQGLMGQAQPAPQQGQPAQQSAPPAADSATDISQDLSPQQIEALKKGYQIAQQILFDESVFGQLMGQVTQEGNPAEILGGTTVQILNKVQESLGEIDFAVTVGLGIKILDDIANAINETGRAQIGEEHLSAAMEFAVQMWLSSNHGKFDPAEVQALAGQMGGV